jgi:hypothetical protein
LHVLRLTASTSAYSTLPVLNDSAGLGEERAQMWTIVGPLAMQFTQAYNGRSSLLVGCGLVASCQHVG